MSNFLDGLDEALKASAEEWEKLKDKKPKECCVNCIHCAEVRKRPIYDSILTKICLYFRNTENSYYILEVADNDKCELFHLNKDKEEEDLIYEDGTTGNN